MEDIKTLQKMDNQNGRQEANFIADIASFTLPPASDNLLLLLRVSCEVIV